MSEIKSQAKKMKMKKRAMRKAAHILEICAGGGFWAADFAGRKLGISDMACNMMMPVAAALEKHSDCYMTYDFYPEKASGQNAWTYRTVKADRKMAIVMTGLIKKEKHFTLETVRFYKKVFPGVRVIVSTWYSEDGPELLAVRKEPDCTVVLSEPPRRAGMQNINYQKKAACEGVKKAAELGMEYVLRARSDTRITANGVLTMLRELLEIYSDREMAGQKKRLILFNAYKYYPFQEAQMFYFGHTDDMLAFFGVPDSRGKKNKESVYEDMARGMTYREAFQETTALNYCIIEYARFLGITPQCDTDQWWKFLGERTICLPMGILRPLWLEYDYNHEASDMTWMYRRGITGAAGMDNTMVDFASWLAMRNGEYDKDRHRELADLPMR